MTYDSESNRIFLTADELSCFAYQRENPAALLTKYGFVKDAFNKPPTVSESVEASVPLEKEVVLGEYTVVVTALADIISFDGVNHTIEVVKTLNYLRRDLTPFSHPENFAKAVIAAYLFSDTYGIPEINLKLSFVKQTTDERIAYAARLTRVSLSRMFDALISRALPFIKFNAEKSINFPDEIKSLPFPFSNIREGQEEFIKSAYRAIKHGEILMVSAPTGIGKTMSSLFPAVKSLGSKSADKVFYVTAKNVTGKVALEAIERMGKHAPHLKAINISAKEQVCPRRKASTSITGRLNCRHCSLMGSTSDDNGKTHVSYRERELAALTELIAMDVSIYTTELLVRVADSYKVCPYELSLDLSEYCSVIVCDYNYVIDDNVRFKRYFKNIENKEKFVFLFDEAHNLPDRTRNTYSAVIQSSIGDELLVIAESDFSDDINLADAVNNFLQSMSEIRELCKENEYYRSTDEGEIIYGFYEDSKVPVELIKRASELNAILSKYIREEAESAELLVPYYDKLLKLIFVSTYFDEKFRFFASRENDKLTVELLCIDPSGILEIMLQPAVSVILFSATLSPAEYFRDVIGMGHAEILELKSPYEKENLCIVAYDSISTKLSDRRDTARECAEVIVETISQKVGNYIVYFPSYDYMKRVCKVFSRLMPECAIVMQKQGMSYRERERFINVFRDRARESVVGFCVLGGMFSEGIDLAGESLIGAIIVGTGMPSLSAERNIMEAYYNENNGRGHEFAYICPGMNKVLQAAGRVIRSENDCGVVVLIDDRYSDPRMKMLFPPHWRHIKYTGDLTSLSVILSDFWDKKK